MVISQDVLKQGDRVGFWDCPGNRKPLGSPADLLGDNKSR